MFMFIPTFFSPSFYLFLPFLYLFINSLDAYLEIIMSQVLN